ncbi:TPA: hypothetical protein ACQ45G_003938, partial [Citrobacter freundii]
AAAPPRQRQGTELDCRPGDALARLPQVQAIAPGSGRTAALMPPPFSGSCAAAPAAGYRAGLPPR